jgi:hypothetical protein
MVKTARRVVGESLIVILFKQTVTQPGDKMTTAQRGMAEKASLVVE